MPSCQCWSDVCCRTRHLPYTTQMHGCGDLGGTMPQSGEVNERFGVYKSVCCDFEIVITKGAIFPICPDHPRQSTTWKLLPGENMTDVMGRKKSKFKPAA